MYQPPPGAAVLEATRGRYTQRLSRAQALHFTKITYKCALALDSVSSPARRSTGMPGYACGIAMGAILSSCAGT
jgi:hypothetical protein